MHPKRTRNTNPKKTRNTNPKKGNKEKRQQPRIGSLFGDENTNDSSLQRNQQSLGLNFFDGVDHDHPDKDQGKPCEGGFLNTEESLALSKETKDEFGDPELAELFEPEDPDDCLFQDSSPTEDQVMHEKDSFLDYFHDIEEDKSKDTPSRLFYNIIKEENLDADFENDKVSMSGDEGFNCSQIEVKSESIVKREEEKQPPIDNKENISEKPNEENKKITKEETREEQKQDGNEDMKIEEVSSRHERTNLNFHSSELQMEAKNLFQNHKQMNQEKNCTRVPHQQPQSIPKPTVNANKFKPTPNKSETSDLDEVFRRAHVFLSLSENFSSVKKLSFKVESQILIFFISHLGSIDHSMHFSIDYSKARVLLEYLKCRNDKPIIRTIRETLVIHKNKMKDLTIEDLRYIESLPKGHALSELYDFINWEDKNSSFYTLSKFPLDQDLANDSREEEKIAPVNPFTRREPQEILKSKESPKKVSVKPSLREENYEEVPYSQLSPPNKFLVDRVHHYLRESVKERSFIIKILMEMLNNNTLQDYDRYCDPKKFKREHTPEEIMQADIRMKERQENIYQDYSPAQINDEMIKNSKHKKEIVKTYLQSELDTEIGKSSSKIKTPRPVQFQAESNPPYMFPSQNNPYYSQAFQGFPDNSYGYGQNYMNAYNQYYQQDGYYLQNPQCNQGYVYYSGRPMQGQPMFNGHMNPAYMHAGQMPMSQMHMGQMPMTQMPLNQLYMNGNMVNQMGMDQQFMNQTNMCQTDMNQMHMRQNEMERNSMGHNSMRPTPMMQIPMNQSDMRQGCIGMNGMNVDYSPCVEEELLLPTVEMPDQNTQDQDIPPNSDK